MSSTVLITNPIAYNRGYGTSPAPTNDNLFQVSNGPPTVGIVNVRDANLTKLLFFGTGNADSQFYAHIYAHSPVLGVQATVIWIPSLVCKVLCTLSTITGIQGRAVTDTDKFCDTILLIEGDPTVKISGDVDNRIASLVCDLEGASFMSVLFSNSALTSAATAANFLAATL